MYTTTRSFSLDFIRSTAVMMIIFYHYNFWTQRTVSVDYILSNYYHLAGPVGVSLFFILSGASLMMASQKKFDTIGFYKKRFISIFPLFYFIYIFFILVDVIIYQQMPFMGKNPVTFLLTIAGLDGLLVYKIPNYYLIGEWFLGCILLIYLVFPLIRYFFFKNKNALLFLSLMLWIITYNFYNLKMPIDRFPAFRIFEFIFGMYFVSVYQENSSVWNISLISIAVLGIGIFLSLGAGDLMWQKMVLGILSFAGLASFSKLIQNIIPKKIVYFTSKYSYTAFLLHHIILIRVLFHMRTYINSLFGNFILLITTVFLIFLLSYLMYNCVRNIIRLPSSQGA